MSNKSLEAQQKVIDEKMGELLEYYASISGGKVPDGMATDKKTYRGIVLRWFEPLIPGEINAMLVEEVLGDNWTLRFERIAPKIQIAT